MIALQGQGWHASGGSWMSTYNLERVLLPRSVAVARASPGPGSVGGILLDNLVSAGFAGSIDIIDLKDEVDGLDRLPNVPDLLVISTRTCVR